MNTINQQEQNMAGNIIQLQSVGDAVSQQLQGNSIVQLCTVMVDSLNVRTAPNSMAPIVASYPQGTTLNFIKVVDGEFVDGNPYWGYTAQGHYYWLGGTNRPQG